MCVHMHVYGCVCVCVCTMVLYLSVLNWGEYIPKSKILMQYPVLLHHRLKCSSITSLRVPPASATINLA